MSHTASHRHERLPLQEPTYDTVIPNSSMTFSFSSKDTNKQTSYGSVSDDVIGQSNSYDLSSSSGSPDTTVNNPARRQNGTIKTQQQSMNPPPLPPSRRRTNSNDQYFRSGSGEYELESPRSGHGYINSFSVPPKAPPRQQSPRSTFNASNQSNSVNNHRRTLSLDSRKLGRHSSSNSLVSMNSQGSGYSQRSITESLKLLPDPRWGGGSGGRTNRARTMSGGSDERGHRKVDSFSSQDGLLLINNGSYGGYYGSVPYTSKDVIMNGLNHSFEQTGGNHRRNPSELSAASFMTAASIDTSVEPARVDPAKSSMFKEIASGIVRLQLPKDNFRLLTDRELEFGHVYKRQLVDNESEYFQDFHTVEEGDMPLQTPSGCHCLCNNCNHCHSRRKTLPPTYYVMSVKSDIYRRMFDEVSESKSMPCGLFFCGHHEDVRYPSIMIAVALVSGLLVAMLVATIYVKG
ncbi:hypothetical protein ACHAWO_011369 [Cyclotella atomus]|uniref:Uncharacterized protein n=1 Tax=Cyclotella atomus TaxID=382360 RepID=A0ABD3Q7Z0_9STRA